MGTITTIDPAQVPERLRGFFRFGDAFFKRSHHIKGFDSQWFQVQRHALVIDLGEEGVQQIPVFTDGWDLVDYMGRLEVFLLDQAKLN